MKALSSAVFKQLLLFFYLVYRAGQRDVNQKCTAKLLKGGSSITDGGDKGGEGQENSFLGGLCKQRLPFSLAYLFCCSTFTIVFNGVA